MGKLIAALIFATVVASGCKPSHEADPQAPWSRLKRGDYLRSDYMSSLCKSRSPLKTWQEVSSGDDSGLDLVTISEDSGGLSVSLGWNFHEGSGPVAPDQDGVLRVSSLALSVESPEGNEFVLSDGKSKTRFRFVGDWQRWANRVIIAGDYTDAKGQKYAFQPEGRALFPGKTFDYKVSLDEVGSNYDYIYSEQTKSTWSVKSTAQGIALYDVDLSGDDPWGVVAQKPRWTPLRQGPSPCP
jgi:hypothetical protein